MAGDLEKKVRDFLRLLDGMDFDAMGRATTEDVQGVDELSRRWMRGRGGLQDYFRQFGPQLSDIHSTLSDMRETVWGDVGVVTLPGNPVSSHVSFEVFVRPALRAALGHPHPDRPVVTATLEHEIRTLDAQALSWGIEKVLSTGTQRVGVATQNFMIKVLR